jgi:hypothetical protein
MGAVLRRQARLTISIMTPPRNLGTFLWGPPKAVGKPA